jgi:hypothetical protein
MRRTSHAPRIETAPTPIYTPRPYTRCAHDGPLVCSRYAHDGATQHAYAHDGAMHLSTSRGRAMVFDPMRALQAPVQFSSVQFSSVQFSSVQFSSVQSIYSLRSLAVRL